MMARARLRGITLVWAVAIAIATSSCLGSIEPSRADLELRAPVRGGFEAVADAMQPSCGTLDCHGQAERNLRLFGGRGLRLAHQDTSGEGVTTSAEYDLDYWGIVALEPEILSTVLQEGGDNPERLILIRKARGTTRHKGGTLMRPNDNLDQCLTGWLKGNILADPCKMAAMISARVPP